MGVSVICVKQEAGIEAEQSMYLVHDGVTLELHCSQPVRVEIFFHVYY